MVVSELPPLAFPERAPVPAGAGAAWPAVAVSVPFTEEWRTGIFGSGIGLSGFNVVDLDGDGTLDIVAGGSTGTFGSNDFFYVLRHDLASGNYLMRWVSDLIPEGISRIAVFDTDGDQDPEIYLGLVNGDVQIFDGKALTQKSVIHGPTSQINQILFADANNDGNKDLVLVTDSKTYLYNPTTHALELQIGYGGSDAKVGNVDGDADLELVLATGKVLDVKGSTVTVKWTYPSGDFGTRLELANIDDDPALEIVAASDWYYITAFDADLQSPKWQIHTDLDISAFRMVDIDGDQVPEIFYGDGQFGAIHCMDAKTQAERWEIENPDDGATDIAVADTDDDGSLEVLWGAGAGDTGADYLYVYGVKSRTQEWKSADLDGPFTAIDTGDVDNDGTVDVAVSSFSSNSGYDDGIVTLYDGATHRIKWQTTPNTFGGDAWTGIHDVKIGDLDGAGTKEVVVGTDRLYDGAIYVLDGANGTVKSSYVYDEGAPISSLAIGDAEGDGPTDIVAGGGGADTGSPGTYVYVINGATGAVKWHSINLGSQFSAVERVRIANVDGDANPEIVAIDGWAYVFDGVTHVQWQSPTSSYNTLEVADVNADGKPDVVLGTTDGKIVALDGTTHAQLLSRSVASGNIDSLAVADVDGADGADVVFANGGRLNVYSISADSLSWQSPVLGDSVGIGNGMALADVDGDRHWEIVTGTDHTINQFQGPYVCGLPGPGLVDPCAIFADGFESGDMSFWSGMSP